MLSILASAEVKPLLDYAHNGERDAKGCHKLVTRVNYANIGWLYALELIPSRSEEGQIHSAL